MNDWDKILDDFAHKCKGGAPDMTNPRHLALLRESLLKFGWNENAMNEFLGNLREGKASEMAKKVGLKHIGGGYYSKTGEKPATHKSSEKGSILVQVDKDEESEVEESEKDIQKRIKDKNQKSARRHTQNRFSEERKEMVKNNHPEYSEYEDDLNQLEGLLNEFTHPDTSPERKREIALQLRSDYGLTTNSSVVNEDGNSKNVKLYIKKLPSGKPVPRWMYKFLSAGGKDPSGGGPSAPQTSLTNNLNEHLDDDNKVESNSVGGDSESKIAQSFATAAKPSFNTPKRTKTRRVAPKGERRIKGKDGKYYYKDENGDLQPYYKTDPVVSEIMGDPPVSELEDKEPGKDSFHSLEGPSDEDGNLISSSDDEGKRKHMEWMVKENKSSQNIKNECDKYIKILEAEDPPNESEIAKYKNLKKAINDHEKEMNRILAKHKIPSKEAEEAVKKANGKLMDDIHNAHPDVAGGIAKQVAEVALVQQELAKGEECYLPSAGNFPGGDKLRVTRNGTKVEKVAGVSVKFVRSGNNTQIYGFPAEAASVARYAEVPKKKGESDEEHKERQNEVRTRSGGKVGQEGHSIGVRDDIVDDADKQSEIIEQSGMGKAIKDKKEYHKITKEIKDEVERFKAEQRKLGKSEDQIEIDLQAHLKDFMSKGKPSINERFEAVIDREELARVITGTKDGKKKDGTTHSNTNMARKCDPIEFLNLATVGSVIREGQGMPSLSWNHQSYENGEYQDETVEADDHDMTNLGCWGFLSRMYRSSGRAKGGGILTTGTGECE
jgi:hypothetical protein